MLAVHVRASTTQARGNEVMRALRSGTVVSHQQVERSLDLTSLELTLPRLREVVVQLSAFWAVAQAGLDEWAQTETAAAAVVQWPLRRRLSLFQDDAAGPGATSADWASPSPVLPAVTGTDQALGRLYVLEGSTLGGQVINRGFAQRPMADPLRKVRLSGLDPYGNATGALWHGLRRYIKAWADSDQRRDDVVEAAVITLGGPGHLLQAA